MRAIRPLVVVSAVAALCGSMLVATGDGIAGPPARSVTGVTKAAQPTLSHLRITFAKRTGAFDQPTQVTNAADGSSRLFVVEKAGRVRVYLGNGKIAAKSYLDLRSKVLDNGEQGMLGIAFRKDFAKKPRFWVSYVAKNGSLQVSRFTPKTAKSTSVSASTERKVITIPHPRYSNHNGGSLAFGPDGYLYVGTGDGGGGGDPFNNAQNKAKLGGKILRLDVTHTCGSHAYCSPSSNPYAKSKTARHEIWVVGVRNPWRFSFDAKTGQLWIGDVGQDKYEEIDRVPAGKGGWNLGWPCREATHTYDTSRCRSGVTYHGPVNSYTHASGQSVTGGFVYRGKTYAKLIAARYVYADFVSGKVWLRGTSGATRVDGSLGGISSFGVNGAGEIYAVTLSGGLYAMKVRKV